MQIADNVFLVGSGQHGMQTTALSDCNVYLVGRGSSYALIDAGSGVEPERIVANIERTGVAMERVGLLLLTHLHGDHAAGARYFHDRFGMQVVAPAAGARWLEEADLELTSVAPAKRAGVYPADFLFPPCPVARRVIEGDTVRVGDMALQVLETPGHARGHVSYLLEEGGVRSLFSGDVVFAGGRVVIQLIWDCIIPEYAATMARLASLRLDRLYPGHGAFLLSEAYRHVEQAHECFARLQVPPNL